MKTATAAPEPPSPDGFGVPSRNHGCTCDGKYGPACKCLPIGREPCRAKAAQAGKTGFQNPQAPADPARQSAVAARAGQMPKSCRATYLKATRGKASPRVAIKAFCLECIGWNRPEVARCTATACPLWMYRPWKSVEEKQRPAAATTGRDNRNPHAQEHGGSEL